MPTANEAALAKIERIAEFVPFTVLVLAPAVSQDWLDESSEIVVELDEDKYTWAWADWPVVDTLMVTEDGFAVMVPLDPLDPTVKLTPIWVWVPDDGVIVIVPLYVPTAREVALAKIVRVAEFVPLTVEVFDAACSQDWFDPICVIVTAADDDRFTVVEAAWPVAATLRLTEDGLAVIVPVVPPTPTLKVTGIWVWVPAEGERVIWPL